MKRQENRAVIAWSEAASAGLVSSADRADMKAPVPRPTPDYGTKCPSRIATPTKKRTDFLLKIGMGGKAILGFSALITHQQRRAGLSTAAHEMRRSS